MTRTAAAARAGIGYEAWYFSRLSICAGATVLAAGAGRVLTGAINPDPVLLVSFGTAAIYWLDDLLDRAGDEQRYVALVAIRSLRQVMLVVALLLAAFASLVQVARAPTRVLVFVGVLGVIAVAFSHWPAVGRCLRRSDYGYVLKPLVESLVWTLGCLMTPVLWTEYTIPLRVWLAVAFLWPLLHVVATLWFLADGTTRAHPSVAAFDFAAVERFLLRVCQVLCLVALAAVMLCTAFGLYPPTNAQLGLFPLALLLFLWIWPAVTFSKRVYLDLVIAVQLGCTVVVVLLD